MNWKTSVVAAFVTVFSTEIIAMFTLEDMLGLNMTSQFVALLDGAVIGFCVFGVYLLSRAFPKGGKRRLIIGDWQNAAVLFLATAGFESAFHPLSENLSKLSLPIDVELFNALLTASAVGALAGWMQAVEEQVHALTSGQAISVRNMGGPVIIGAIVCAMSVSAVAGIREVNEGLSAQDALVAVDVSNAMSRQRALTEKIGRVVLLQLQFGGQEQTLTNTISLARAQGQAMMRTLAQFVGRNRDAQSGLVSMPLGNTLERAWNRVLDRSRLFARADGAGDVALGRSVQDAIEEFTPLADQVIASVSAFQRIKDQHESSDLGNTLSAMITFLMAVGMLWPLLRLTGAQKNKIGRELLKAERLNGDLTAYQRALDSHAIFAVTDRMGRIKIVNDHFCKISGYEREYLLGQNHRLLSSGTHPPEVFADLWRTISQGKSWRGAINNRAQDGSLYWVDTCVTPLLGADGKPEQYVSISYDISERKKAQTKVERKAQLDVLLGEMRQELFLSGSMYTSMVGVLKAFNLICGAPASLVCEVGRTLENLAWSLVLGHHKNGEVTSSTEAGVSAKLLEMEKQPALIRDVVQQDGLFGGLGVRQLGADSFHGFPILVGYEPVGVLLVASSVNRDAFSEEIQTVVAALGDLISSRRESDRRRSEEEKTRKQAKRDPLTGLGNRRDLTEEFESRIDHPDAKFALLLVDLDRFKPINDTYGHQVGDTVLRVVAERLRAAAHGDVTVSRIGGDEFAILTQAHAHEDEAEAVQTAQRILDELSAPIDCGGHEIRVGASVGVALYPRDGATFQELLHRADAAMYRAKGNRSEAQVFNASMDESIRDKAELETDLRKAIEAGDIVPWFQPYIDLATGEIAGHEVLARWKHETRGFVPPSDFIKIAEEAGMVDKLFWQFLRKSCLKHLELGLDTMLSLNLSPAQINNPLIAKQLIAELDGLKFPPRLLEVEITETSMIGDVDRARPLLLLLKSHGIRIALDDFGTGYSSLALLRNMPIHKVKIDRSFTSNLAGGDGTDVTIVNAILGIAKALGLVVTAEGIETQEVAQYLRYRGCEYGQGYLYGRAEPEPLTVLPGNETARRVAGLTGARS